MMRLVSAACLAAAVSPRASGQAPQAATWSSEDFQTTLVPWLLGDFSNNALSCQGKPCATGVLLANALLAACAECDVVILPAAALSPEGLPEIRRLLKGSRVTPGHVHALLRHEGPLEMGNVSKTSLETYLGSMSRWSGDAGFPQISQNMQVLVDTSVGSAEVKWRGKDGDGCSSLRALPEQVMVGGPGLLFGSGGLPVNNMVELNSSTVGLAVAACSGLDGLKHSGGAWDIPGDEQLESGCGKAGEPSVQAAPAYCPSAFAWQAAPCFSFRLLHTSEIGGESFPLGPWWLQCWNASLGPLSPMTQGCVGGAKTRGQYLQSMSDKYSGSSVIVDAGNHYFGGDFFDSHVGAAEGRFLDLQPYDAITVNRHDLVVKWSAEVMTNFLQEYSGPLVMTNAAPKGSKWSPVSERTSKYHVKTLQHGEKVGIVGVMSNELVVKSTVGADWDMNPNHVDTSVFGVDATLMLNTAAGINKMRMQQKTDVVVALLGLSAAEAVAVLQNSEGIDVAVLSIVTAGDVARQIHGDVEGFDWNTVHQIAVESKVVPGKRVLVVSTPWKGTHIGNMVIDIDQWGSAVRWSGASVAMDHIVEAATDAITDHSDADSIVGAVQSYYEAKQLQYGVVVATIPQVVEHEQLDCWTGDCPITRLVADSVMSYCEGQCDLAYISVGGVRSGLSAGEVSLNEIAEVAPFQDQFLVVKIPGSILKAALRHSASQCTHGGWAQFAGLRLAVPDVAPGELDELESTKCVAEYVVAEVCKKGSWTVDGGCSQWEDIKDRQIYTMATLSWLAVVGGDGYRDFFPGLEKVEGIARQQDRLAIRDFLESQALPPYPTMTEIKSACSGNSDTEGWGAGCRVVYTSMPPPPPVASDDEGMRFDEATGTYTLCPAGTQSTYDRKICQECSVGRVAPRSGMGLCLECSPGKFQNATGQETCLDCPLATFSRESASSQCEECPVGRSGSERGQMECTACSVGFFQSAPGESECTACPRGEITSKRVLVEGREQWVPLEGAGNASSCGCGIGTRLLGGACVACGDEETDGLVCNGKDDIIISPGFYAADASLSVFQCRSKLQCPGGEPGATCAPGREGIACAVCKEDTMDNGDGTCVPCGESGTDKVFVVFLCIFVFVGLVGMYIFVDRGRSKRSSHAVLLMTLVASMCVTLFQQLGVISLFEGVEWKEPIKTQMAVTRILVLDIDVLRADCVARMTPLSEFIIQVCLVGICVLVIVITHIVVTLMIKKQPLSSSGPSLWGSMGTIFMGFFITVVTAVLGPLQCISNPNGKLTVRAYPSIICWETDEHLAMVAVSVIAVMVPAGFFAFCCYLVRVQPRKMAEGDAWFLQSYYFLFFRYKPQVHWYVLVHMARSFALAMVPIIPYAPAQILCMDITMITQLVVTVSQKPWRLPRINQLDNIFTVSILVVLICASFYTQRASEAALAWVAATTVTTCFLCLPIAMLVLGLRLLQTQRAPKRFQYFLCHSERAGAFTRLLQIQLRSTQGVSREVAMDTDMLSDVDKMLDCVAHKTDTLVVVASRGMLLRPWCMAQISIAQSKSIGIVKVVLPDYEEPNDGFICDYANVLQSNMTVIANNGVSLTRAQETMRWFRELPWLKVPTDLQDDLLKHLCESIEQRVSDADLSKTVKSTKKSSIYILVDKVNLEARASALILERMVAPHFANEPGDAPQVLYSGETLPASVEKVILICSGGVLDKVDIMDTLLELNRKNIYVVPVLVDTGFEFPTMFTLGKQDDSACGKQAPDIIAMFRTVSILFQAKTDSEQGLEAKVEQVVMRLASGVGVAGYDKRKSNEARDGESEPSPLTTPVSSCRGSAVGEAEPPTAVNIVQGMN